MNRSMTVDIVQQRPSSCERAVRLLALHGRREGDQVQLPIPELARLLGTSERGAKGLLTRLNIAQVAGLATMPADSADEAIAQAPDVSVAPGALAPVLSFVSEILTASAVARDSGEPVQVFGGRHRGHDVASLSGQLIDAKNLTRTNDWERGKGAGDWKLTRADHQPFSSDVAISLVSGLDPAAVRIAISKDEITLRIPTARTCVSVKDPATVNAWLEPGCGARVVWVPNEALS